jgi:hypothetical protein
MIEVKLCQCGCGNQVSNGRTYIHGHNRKGKPSFFLGKHHTEQERIKMRQTALKRPPMSEKTKLKLKSYLARPEVKQAMSEKTKRQWEVAKLHNTPIGMLGRHHSEETRAKLVQSHIGKHPTKEQNIKNSNAQKGELNHFYGKHHTKESLLKMSKAHKGSYHTEGTKAKMSKAHKGKVFSEGHRSNWIKARMGRYVKEETKMKLREITLKQWQDIEYREQHSGECNGNWLGGKSLEPYGRDFNEQLKELIRMRDAYICQLCGTPETEICRKLGIHHIDYTKRNNMPNNLISLCPVCHTNVNCNREYWTDYFRNLLNQRQISPKAFIKRQKFPDLVVSA